MVGNDGVNRRDAFGLWQLNFMGKNWTALEKTSVEGMFASLKSQVPSIQERLKYPPAPMPLSQRRSLYKATILNR